MKKKIEDSELILNADGSIYHLHLLPHQLADDIILVGDQNRVTMISNLFSVVEHKVSNREFVSHTGIFNNKRISVISTGIGPDNLDIVINELDALVNIDLTTKTIKDEHTKLRLVRIGTSGTIQPTIPVDSFVLSEYALGLDNLMYYYQDYPTVVNQDAMNDFQQKAHCKIPNVLPYIVNGNPQLIQKLAHNTHKGITATAPGFYGPQGRILRKNNSVEQFNEILAAYQYRNTPITNFEMETSALYGLSLLLEHDAATVCVIVANRATKQFSKNYQIPMQALIEKVLHDLTT